MMQTTAPAVRGMAGVPVAGRVPSEVVPVGTAAVEVGRVGMMAVAVEEGVLEERLLEVGAVTGAQVGRGVIDPAALVRQASMPTPGLVMRVAPRFRAQLCGSLSRVGSARLSQTSL